MLSLGVAILTFNRPSECSRAIRSCMGFNFDELMVLDNGSDVAFEFDDVKVLRSEVNVGVSRGRNRLVSEMRTDLILFLDDDGTLDQATDIAALRRVFFENDDLSAVAGLFYRESNVEKHEYPKRKLEGFNERCEVGYFVGGASIIRRSHFLKVGGFDPTIFYGHEETSISLEFARRNGRILYDPNLRVLHKPSVLGRKPADEVTAMMFGNRIRIAFKFFPTSIASIHLMIWLFHSFFSLQRKRNGTMLKHEVVKSFLAAKSFDKRQRFTVRDSIRLHRKGYRVLY